MTPTMEAPSAPAGGEGFDLNSSLDAAFASDSVEQQPDDQGTQPDPVPDETGTEQPTDPPVAGDDEVQTDEKNRTYYRVDPSRMQKFTAANKFLSEISEFAPTIEAARLHHELASDFRALQSTFASGEPEEVGKFMDYWAEGAPDGFQAMSAALPEYLDKAADAGAPWAASAISKIAGHVYARTLESMYERARNTGNPDHLARAQHFDFALNGRYHDSLDKIPVRQQPVVDQVKQREAALAKRESEYIARNWQEFDGQHLGGAIEKALASAVENGIRPFEASFQGAPGLLAAAKREAISQVKAELAKSYELKRNHDVEVADIQRDISRALRSGEKTDNLTTRAAALVQNYNARVSRALPGILKTLIGERTQSVMQNSQATHNRLANGASKQAPGSGGKPPQRSIAPMRPRQSVADRLDELFG